MGKKLTGKVNSVYDILKFAMCIIIVAVHTWILPKWTYPLARLAVPVFFIISSFFFFSKIKKINNPADEKKALKGFVKRNLQLYLFWFIALLPFTWKIKEWFSGDNIALEILRILRSILFSSSFRASWFIMALAIATVIIYYASKLFDNRVLLVLAALVYIAVCLRSSYYDQIKGIGLMKALIERYELVYTASYNSFPVALIWVMCGKCFADGTFRMKRNTSFAFLAVSLLCLYAEWYAVRKLGGGYKNDCYFMLLPASVALFSLVMNIKPFEIRGSATIRKMSTVIYALHATAASVLRDMIVPRYEALAFLKNDYLVFAAVLLFCFAVCAVLFLLERIKVFRWLRYSH